MNLTHLLNRRTNLFTYLVIDEVSTLKSEFWKPAELFFFLFSSINTTNTNLDNKVSGNK